jgi:16S rRNA (cytosine1402-N4)-methyltransferase
MEATSLCLKKSPNNLWTFDDMLKTEPHKPVMCQEILEYLKLTGEMTVVDATIGCGGHSSKILEHLLPRGRLIGIDRDQEVLKIAKARLSSFDKDISLIHGNFRDLDKILAMAGIDKVDAIIFDLGLSSVQLSNPERGFSFQLDGPLDMRMDRSSFIQAYDLINNLNEEEISSLLWSFGQERFHNRIAHLLVMEREKAPLNSTSQVADIVLKAIPPHYYRLAHIHPATRTFQAIRIAVNRELEALDEGIKKAIDSLKEGGRIAVISFHSLEDRIVKINFRTTRSEGKLKIITPKPLRPSQEERTQNPSSRSARLRVAVRK